MIEYESTSDILIHLDRLDHNVSLIRDKIGSGVKLMAVVKDNAYGHGMNKVAQHIQEEVDWFCVAKIEEGIQLREQGVKNPILIFEVPRSKHVDDYVRYNLTATVSDLETISGLKTGTEYHMLFDTGMHRLGLTYSDIDSVRQQIEEGHGTSCTGIYTHFANADQKNHPSVLKQLELFKKIRSRFSENLFTHVANTGIVLNYDQSYLFDGVRTGIALMGYSPNLEKEIDLLPVLEWNSYVSQVRKIKKGESVSYGTDWIAKEDGIIGTIPVGYANGISRNLRDNINFYIDGKAYQQVGAITMDYCMIFSNDMNSLKKGQKVSLIDLQQNDVYYWAKMGRTIPYEITTQLCNTINRKYK